MYGMINNALQQMIVTHYGDAQWGRIKLEAGVDIDGFVSMHSYPDQITYNIVGHAANILSVPATSLLEEVGEYWIIHTAQVGYGDMLNMVGDNLVDFMKNLNSMHSRLSHMFPSMIIPTFEISDVTDRSMIVHYKSKRQGLEYMVIGLIRGLGKKFELDCDIRMTDAELFEGSSQKFEVTW